MNNFLKYKIQDRKLYYDNTGLLLHNGDFIYAPTSEMPTFGICEYAKFNFNYYNIESPDKPTKEEIKFGLIVHVFNLLPNSAINFYREGNIKNLNKTIKDKSTSDYSNKFHCHIYYDSSLSGDELICTQLLKVSNEIIRSRFPDENYNLFINVQEKIINTDNKIYNHYEIERNNNYAR